MPHKLTMPQKTHQELVAELAALDASSEEIHARKSEIVRALIVQAGPLTLNIVEGVVTVAAGRIVLADIPTEGIRRIASALVSVADRLDAK